MKPLPLFLLLISAFAKAADPGPGFESLFDGRTLDGWKHTGNWEVLNGEITRVKKGGPLTYEKAKVPDDFELRFDWKVAKGCNSGVYYRPGQYEYQLLDNANSTYGENPRSCAGALYFCMGPAKDVVRPFNEWNEGRIICKGTVIQHWLNGEKVVDFDYTDPRWAAEVKLVSYRGTDLSKRGGQLWLQDHGENVSFRNLRWRAIPADEKLATENLTPMPVSEAALKKEAARIQELLNAKKKPAAAAPKGPEDTAPSKPAGAWRHEELRRFKAEEARQGVAVDAEFFYAITNEAIGKYRKDNGAKAGEWKDTNEGSFGPDGNLFITGHDAQELYVLGPPRKGADIPWKAAIPISAHGQAFAWDRAEKGILYSIERKTHEVIVSRITYK